MNKATSLTIMLLLLVLSLSKAQTVLLEQDVTEQSYNYEYGANGTHYVHAYAGVGFAVLPENTESMQIIVSESPVLLVGARYKYRINDFFASGIDASLSNTSYQINQTLQKTFPTTDLHLSETLRTGNLNIEYYARINYAKRGNYMGIFSDLGVYASFLAWSKLIVKDEKLSPEYGKTKIVHSRLSYLAPFNYGLSARMGINRVVVFASYAMSNLLTDKPTIKMPRLFAGIQYGIH